MRKSGSFWFGPAVPGLLLILVGVLIFVFPALLAYAVASAFVAVGVFLTLVAWRLRIVVDHTHVEPRTFDQL